MAPHAPAAAGSPRVGGTKGQSSTWARTPPPQWVAFGGHVGASAPYFECGGLETYVLEGVWRTGGQGLEPMKGGGRAKVGDDGIAGGILGTPPTLGGHWEEWSSQIGPPPPKGTSNGAVAGREGGGGAGEDVTADDVHTCRWARPRGGSSLRGGRHRINRAQREGRGISNGSLVMGLCWRVRSMWPLDGGWGP